MWAFTFISFTTISPLVYLIELGIQPFNLNFSCQNCKKLSKSKQTFCVSIHMKNASINELSWSK